MNKSINRVKARRIWDSRGRPTVEVEVETASGHVGRGIAPAGASRGSNEAIDLRDGGSALGGYDVQRALRLVEQEIAPRIMGMNTADQSAVDAALLELGGTPNKARLGGSSTIATSLAVGRDGQYRLALEDRGLGRDGWLALLDKWLRTYPIRSVEDPVAEDDREGMIEFTRSFGDRVQVIGDDFLVTNADRVRSAEADGARNAVLIKLDQAGTVTETWEAMQAGREFDWGTIVSARSGETEDISIAHLAVGWDAGQLKVGSFTRSERMARW